MTSTTNTSTTVHDLATPLLRAQMLADTADIVVIEADLPGNVLAVWTLGERDGETSHVVLVQRDDPEDLRAEAMLFMVALLNSDAVLDDWINTDGDGAPMIGVTRKRVEPDTGYGRLAVAMATECGIAAATSFVIAQGAAR